MPTSLDALLHHIRPQRTYDEANRRADEALAGFNPPQVVITNYQQFQECLCRFGLRLDRNILRFDASTPAERYFIWSKCLTLLRRLYKGNGEKAAFEMVRTGHEGALNRVLRELAEAWADDCAENEIRRIVNVYWNGLSPERKCAAGDEYLQKYGRLLPFELIEGGAGRVRADLPKFLIQHVKTLRRLRRAVRPTT